MTTETPEPEPRYERYRLAYPSGGDRAFYAGGAPLEEVRVTHPLAAVEAAEDSLVGEFRARPWSFADRKAGRTGAGCPWASRTAVS